MGDEVDWGCVSDSPNINIQNNLYYPRYQILYSNQFSQILRTWGEVDSLERAKMELQELQNAARRDEVIKGFIEDRKTNKLIKFNPKRA